MGRFLGTRVCAYPKCSTLVDTTYCNEHANKTRSSYTRNNYGSKWQSISRAHLAAYPQCQCEDPNCRVCKGNHRRLGTVLATDVDHIIPLSPERDRKLSHSSLNLQSLCKRCHSSKTIRKDRIIPARWG